MASQWYKFKYYDSSGRSHTDYIKSKSERLAKQYIHSKKFNLLWIRQRYFFEFIFDRFKKSRIYLLFFQYKLSKSELYWFTKELVSFLDSGLPLLDALESLRGFSATKRFQYVLNTIIKEVSYGKALSDSMELFPSSFPKYYIISVRSGEQVGQLSDSLRSNAVLTEWINVNRGKIIQATFFPMISTILIIGAFIVSLKILVPYFMQALNRMSIKPPVMTQVMFDFNEWLSLNGSNIVGVLYIFLLSFALFVSNKRTGYYFERYILLRLPLYGSIYVLFSTALLSNTLSILVKQKFSILESFRLCKDMFNSPLFKREMDDIYKKVALGYSVGQAFQETRLFPKFMSRMIYDGERTGTFEQKLFAISDLYKTKLENKVEWVFKMIPPVYLVFTLITSIFFGYVFFWPVWKLYF
jgi:general secretion pathway protein F